MAGEKGVVWVPCSCTELPPTGSASVAILPGPVLTLGKSNSWLPLKSHVPVKVECFLARASDTPRLIGAVIVER